MIRRLKRHNAAAVNTLDWLCHIETMREILDAMTPQQFVVAALLVDGMTPMEIARELDESIQLVCCRRKAARERVASAMYHKNAEHLHGDVLSRTRKVRKLKDYHQDRGKCPDCGRVIHRRSTRCNSCAQRARYRREREEVA